MFFFIYRKVNEMKEFFILVNILCNFVSLQDFKTKDGVKILFTKYKTFYFNIIVMTIYLLLASFLIPKAIRNFEINSNNLSHKYITSL